MKKIVFVFLLVVSQIAKAQDPAYPPAAVAPLNLVKAEYFIDTDPGFGLGIDIPVSAAVNINGLVHTVNVSALSPGVHRLGVRSLNTEGEWSMTSIIIFGIDPFYGAAPAAPLQVVKAEYFIDTDPGFGSGTDILLSAATDIAGLAATINTAGLPIGTHKLYVRTRNVEGEWSLTTVRQFVVDFDPPYPGSPSAALQVVRAEYFVDTDPGFGSGIDIPFAAAVDVPALLATINTASLLPGAHRLFVRSRNAEGEWSMTSADPFVIDVDPAYPAAPAPAGNIIRAEYFIDADPGFGNGSSIALTPATDINNLTFAVNTAALSGGTHYLFVRSLDDWSLTSVRAFDVDAPPAKVVLSGALTGNFQSLKEAADAINAGGGSGTVTATVVGNTTETAQVVFNQTGYTVSVVPDGNRVVEGNIANPLILLNQADNVTIDGLSQTGSNTLTIRNTNTGNGSNAIRIFGEAVNNTVKRCIIEASSTGSVLVTGALALLVDNEAATGNLIDSNHIRAASATGMVNGIGIGRQFSGSLGTINNTQIVNNRIENAFASTSSFNHGILVLNGVSNTLIRGNSVYNTLPFNNAINDANYIGIRVNSAAGSGTTIDSNYIGGSLPGASGGNLVISSPVSSISFAGIGLTDVALNPSSVTRNVIRNLDLEIANPGTITRNPFQGINVTAANLQAFNNNIIGSDINHSILLHMKPASTGPIGSFGYVIQAACATPVAGNFVGGLTITNTPLAGSTVTPFLNLFDVRGSIATLNLKNNILGSAAAGNISFNSTTSGAFNVSGVFVSSTAVSQALNIDSNTVRNIAATGGGSVFAIRVTFGSAATSSSSLTFNGNIVRNLSVSGNNSSIRGLQYDLAATVSNLSHLVNIDGNEVRNLTVPSGSGTGVQGIRLQNGSIAVNRIRGRITSNTIDGLFNAATGNAISRGIVVSNDVSTTDSLVIGGNTINNLVSIPTTANTGNVSEGNGITYEAMNSGLNGVVVTRDNVISNISVQSTDNTAMRVLGMMMFGNNIRVERNRVFGLANAATSPHARITGLYLRSRADDASVGLVRNNMIALNTTAAGKVMGVELGDGAVNTNLYHNSVLVEGAMSANSYALFKTATAVADVKNTILYNAATGAGTAYAVGLETSVAGYSSNNNYFVSPVAASLAEINGTAQSLAAWRTATSQDAATEEGASGVNTNAANLFTGKTTAQLLVNTLSQTEPLKVSDKGMALPDVLTDFLGSARSATTPDIGAHEFLFSPPLPLTLLSFSGEKQQQDVLLHWRTANEIDLSRFEVQRSDNGTDFRTIGTVSPGSSRYTFADPNVFVSKSVVFYRLKSVDLDGRFTYSAIIRLSKQLTGTITVFPNPVQDVMTVSGLRQGGVLRLVTADGRLLVQLPVQAQTVTLDMSRYAKGLYYLHYQQGGEMQTRPILRQ